MVWAVLENHDWTLDFDQLVDAIEEEASEYGYDVTNISRKVLEGQARIALKFWKDAQRIHEDVNGVIKKGPKLEPAPPAKSGHVNPGATPNIDSDTGKWLIETDAHCDDAVLAAIREARAASSDPVKEAYLKATMLESGTKHWTFPARMNANDICERIEKSVFRLLLDAWIQRFNDELRPTNKT